MRRQIVAITLALILQPLSISCGSSHSSGPQSQSSLLNPQPSSQKSANVEDLAALCNRISDIKILPQKGESGEDQAYDAFMNAGEKVVPCLIEKVSDTTKMRDPRQEPGYPDVEFRIGDIAYFLIVDITKIDFVKFLPPEVQRKYASDGVYAYLKYVQRYENRKTLQRRLREWHRQK